MERKSLAAVVLVNSDLLDTLRVESFPFPNLHFRHIGRLIANSEITALHKQIVTRSSESCNDRARPSGVKWNGTPAGVVLVNSDLLDTLRVESFMLWLRVIRPRSSIFVGFQVFFQLPIAVRAPDISARTVTSASSKLTNAFLHTSVEAADQIAPQQSRAGRVELFFTFFPEMLFPLGRIISSHADASCLFLSGSQV